MAGTEGGTAWHACTMGEDLTGRHRKVLSPEDGGWRTLARRPVLQRVGELRMGIVLSGSKMPSTSKAAAPE